MERSPLWLDSAAKGPGLVEIGFRVEGFGVRFRGLGCRDVGLRV